MTSSDPLPRGKKKELVRGLQQLRGSWWRVLKIELILVGV
jgi:hypothetical protein